MKAKVDHLNLVFVILKPGLGSWEALCVSVCMAGGAQCLLIVSAFTVISRCWKHVWFFCGV